MTRNAFSLVTMCVLAVATGCHAIDFYTPSLREPVPPELEPPRELAMVSLPPYRIEPPDKIEIDVTTLVPRPSYRIGPLDVLQVNVLGTLRTRPIRGLYRVEGDGTMDLGMPYGVARVAGLTIEEAEAEIARSLQLVLKEPKVSLVLSRSATAEQLAGVYDVAPDGTVNLGRCGMVYVTGKTVVEARKAVEEHLAQYFDSPKVGVAVVQYKSKSYYLVSESLIGNGSMWRFPITGNETVLDALSQAPQLKNMSSKTIFVARPAPEGAGDEQILPVDWDAVAHGGRTDTNYQLMPGDRVYVVADSAIAVNTVVGRFADPIMRLLSITSLGTAAAKGTQILGRDYNKRRGY
jgi:polysaccharide biosynthesis/export protein